ncbi:MAG: hypothetical protein M1549_03755 [Candidatus Dependentiae bacterium]|nr:hypothetical protein [Candidatus Dependentiae bacterium]
MKTIYLKTVTRAFFIAMLAAGSCSAMQEQKIDYARTLFGKEAKKLLKSYPATLQEFCKSLMAAGTTLITQSEGSE